MFSGALEKGPVLQNGITMFRSSLSLMFFQIGLHEILVNFDGNICVGVSF